MKRSTLKSKIAVRIARSKREVFMRPDFKDMGGYDQVGRALRQLVVEGVILRLGYGLYAKARKSSLSGKPMPSSKGGFSQVAHEALARLGVAWDYTDWIKDYQAGSNQIPVRPAVVIAQRFTRKISDGSYVLEVYRPTKNKSESKK